MRDDGETSQLDGLMAGFEEMRDRGQTSFERLSQVLHALTIAGRVEDAASLMRAACGGPGNKDLLPPVSVVIATKDRRDYLERCLLSLFDRSYHPLQVIVVNDGSSDGTAELLDELSRSRDDLVVFHNEFSIGYAGSTNKGFRLATGDYVGFLNDDVEVTEGWDAGLTLFMHADPSVGFATPLILNPDGTIQSMGQIEGFRSKAHPDIAPLYCSWRTFGQNANGKSPSDLPESRLPRECEYGMFGLMRREAFTRVGRFDEGYDIYCTDPDLCLKIRLAGWRNVYSPTSVIIHHELSRQVSEKSRERLQRSQQRFVKKWKACWVPIHRVSMYVPCYNAGQYLDRCLNAIQKQTYPIEEILLIDDGSTDNSLAIAQNYPVRIIRHEKNLGLAAARNTALKHAVGDFIATVDSDVEAAPDWLEKLMAGFAHEAIAGVGGKLLEAKTVCSVDQWRATHMKQHWGDERALNPDFLYGANNVFRAHVLRGVGGYDASLRSNYEDCTMSECLKEKGHALLYEPSAVARHLRTDSLHSVLTTYWRWLSPQYQQKGCYQDIDTLQPKLRDNAAIALSRIRDDLSNKRSHLLYPSFLLMLAHTLLDLRHLSESSPKPESGDYLLAAHALYLGIVRILKERIGPPQKLMSRIESDLSFFLTPNEGLENLPGGSGFLDRIVTVDGQTGSISVAPHFGYVSRIVSTALQCILDGLNLDPMVWRMMQPSAERIHVEAAENPNQKGGFKVMLLNPPWRTGSRAGVRAGSRWPFTMEIGDAPIPGYMPFPFFLAYATALLKREGLNAVIVDAIAEGLSDEQFMERIAGFTPDLVLIETATPSVHVDIQVGKRIKQATKGRTLLAYSGTHVTALGKDFFAENPDADILLTGEYEAVLLEVVKKLDAGLPLHGTSNVLHREANGAIVVNEAHVDLLNLEELPWPERLSLPMYNYNDQFAGMPYPNVQVVSTRGCPYGCIFCVWPQILFRSHQYRTRAPADVADEIQWLKDLYGFKAFYFDDDTFNIGKQRVLEICNEIQRKGINLPWAAMARADTSDRETLAAMAKCGLFAIKFGVESGEQELVDRCGKRLDLSKVYEAVQACKELGIQTHLTFTLGLPGETLASIEKTVHCAIGLDPDTVQFSLTTPFPGTEYFRELDEKKLLLSKDWKDYDGNATSVVLSENLSQDTLRQALHQAHLQWNQHVQQRMHVSPSVPFAVYADNKGKPQASLDRQHMAPRNGDGEERERLRKELKEFYTNYKQYYVTNAYYQMARQSTGDRFSDYLFKYLRQDQKVLDIGSASGVLTMEAARFAKMAVGVDISPAAGRLAERLKEIEHQRFCLLEETLEKDFQSSKLRNTRFVSGSAEELPFADGTFDLIFSTEVFEHIVDPFKAFEEIYRILKPHGHAILNIPRPQIDINLNIQEWEHNFSNMPDKDAVSVVHAHLLDNWIISKNLKILNRDYNDYNIFVHLTKIEDKQALN
jgi:GT2 family glycosyltransferase/radical SAM superfamily enzyme YgiQ (UPF0313 family)/16S rRNA G966 N2-methylase RsmD